VESRKTALNKKHVIAVVVALGALLFGMSLYETDDISSVPKSGQRPGEVTMDGFPDLSPEVPASSAKILSPLDRALQTYLDGVQKIFSDYGAAAQSLNLAQSLSSQTMVNPVAARAAKARISALAEEVPRYIERLVQEANSFEKQLAALPNSTGEQALALFRDTRSSRQATTQEFFDLQKSLLGTFTELLDLAIAHAGQVSIEGNQLNFPSLEAMTSYRSLWNRIGQLAESEAGIKRTRQKQMDEIQASLAGATD